MLRLICAYAPLSGRRLEEKQCFYDELTDEWNMHSAVNFVMCLGDFNRHICRYIAEFDGGYGIDR